VGLETGEITLQIGIDVDEAGAAKLTRALLMMEEDEEVELEDITDAMGEIANMVAGGVKSRLIAVESSLTIGLPHFVEGETDDSNTLVLHQHWLTARDSAGDIPVCLSITRPRAS
jgi:CheY-specific phosphatase CheX